MLSLLFVGCGGSSTDQDETTVPDEAAAPTTEAPQTTATTDESAATSTTAATDEAGGVEALYERAQEEGNFTYHGPEDPEEIQAYLDAFAEAYPGVTMNHVSAFHEDFYQQALVQTQAGNESGLGLFACRPELNEPLIDAGIMETDPQWAELGVDEELLGPDGSIVMERGYYTLAYNTDLTDESELPESWEGLADAEWEGRISLEAQGDPWQLMAPEWGLDRTVEFVDQLIETTNPSVIDGATNGLTAMASGNAAIRPALLHDALFWKNSGAPIDYVWLDFSPAELGYYCLASDAASPNAAKLFAYWYVVSDEAEDLRYSEEYKTARIPPELPEDLPLSLPVTAEDFEIAAEILNAVVPMLQGE